ncbi:MAG TPA: hypothetical protein VK661_08345 [Planctomycetota bacterium]|nr:hypothetical protein [Planctomycetota bacterium]
MAETCPSCGAPLSETDSRCQRCGSATTRRYVVSGAGPKGPTPPTEITLPCTIPEARFTVGEAWTHGLLHLTDFGMYFLAEQDGPWTAERLATSMPPDPGSPHRVADSSFYVPLNRIERIQHSRLTTHAVFIRGQKKPLRLTPEGWKLVDAFAAKSGIPTL